MPGSLGFNISMVSLSLYMTLAAHRPRTVYRQFLLCPPPSPLARYPPPLSIFINVSLISSLMWLSNCNMVLGSSIITITLMRCYTLFEPYSSPEHWHLLRAHYQREIKRLSHIDDAINKETDPESSTMPNTLECTSSYSST